MEGEEDPSSGQVPSYKVGMLGASGVGKTALTAQFTTSDYICAYDASLGKFYQQNYLLSRLLMHFQSYNHFREQIIRTVIQGGGYFRNSVELNDT